MKSILLVISCFFSLFVFSQARMVINNNGYVRITNNAYLVIDNGNANALATAGTGGNILSESENNVIKWNVSSNTGNYVIPWTNPTSGTKIPLTVAIGTAGSAGGSLLLATYHTTAMNVPWPSDVNNMCSSVTPTADASYFAIDRYWRIDAGSYTTKPAAILSFGYDYPNEGGGPNTINEANLKAQRFNPGAGAGNYCMGTPSVGTWQDLLFGVVNTGTKQVANVAVSPADFFKSWVLVDQSHPLPIELTNFSASCGDEITLHWSTATENNVNHFEIYSSRDGNQWNAVANVPAVGNSSTENSYEAVDHQGNGLLYYQLISVDNDGKQQVYGPISAQCDNLHNSWTVYPNPANQFASVSIKANNKVQEILSIIDINGRIIYQQDISLQTGNNLIQLPIQQFACGSYILRLRNHEDYKPLKLVKVE